MQFRSRVGSCLGASLLVLALVASACGDDDDAAPAGDDATTVATEAATDATATEEETATDAPTAVATEPATEATEETEETETAEPPADPVTVWVIEDSSEAAGVTFPNVRAGIQARVDRINAERGLGGSGRSVEVEFCVTDFDPNAAAQCARDAADDDTAIAVAASVSANGDAVLPILEEGGLASVGSTAFSQTDGTSTVSFPTMGGLVSATGCQATVLRDVAGATAIGVARSDTPGADQVGALLAALGLPPVGEVVTPVANPDYSAEMGAIAAQADSVVLAQDGATAIKAVTALRLTGSDIPVAGSGGQGWTPEKLGQAGDAAEGMYLSLWYAADDMPGAAAYLADMEAAGALDQSDDLAKLGWIAFELLDQVAATVDTIDRETILAGLGATAAFDGAGLTPTIDYTTPGALLFGALPRFVNDSCVYAQVVDGVVAAVDGEFVTPFRAG